MQINVLLIGSGAREHALAWKISGSALLRNLYCIGPNPGFIGLANIINIAYDNINHNPIIELCKKNNIDLVVIGPEQPIINGLANALAQHKIAAFAPFQAAAKLESSKIFTKNLLANYMVPSPNFKAFYNKAEAKKFIANQPLPVVIKADGPALGKGTFVATTIEQANNAIEECTTKYGSAILIEEYLTGKEVSFFVLYDGKTPVNFGYARDYKKLYDNDKGPNTGGMGAYSSQDLLDSNQKQLIMFNIIHPTLTALRNIGLPYKGILFAGIMLTPSGPKLLEYNVRLGDPECQALLLRLNSDILQLFIATINGTLDSEEPNWYEYYSINIVLASKGYPYNSYPGKNIDLQDFIDKYNKLPNLHLFFGNIIQPNIHRAVLKPQGGRLLNIAAIGANLEEAQALAYRACADLDKYNLHYRKDIGKKL